MKFIALSFLIFVSTFSFAMQEKDLFVFSKLSIMLQKEIEITQDYLDFVANEPSERFFLEGRLSAFIQISTFLDNPEQIKYYSN